MQKVHRKWHFACTCTRVTHPRGHDADVNKCLAIDLWSAQDSLFRLSQHVSQRSKLLITNDCYYMTLLFNREGLDWCGEAANLAYT